MRSFRNAALLPRAVPVLLIWAAFIATDPNFRTMRSLFPILEGLALLGLVAAGIAITIVAGELDLSVAAVAAAAGVLAVLASQWGLAAAILIPTAAAAVFGLLQGFLIARLGVSSLVFTLASLIGVRGVAYILAGGSTITLPADRYWMSDLIATRLFVFSPFSITALVVLAVVGVLGMTRMGREIQAMGGGRNEAIGGGVSKTRSLTVAFGMSAGLAGLAGAMACLKSGSAIPSGFEPLLLGSIAAVLIGGVSLRGGIGNVGNVLLGALAVRIIASGIASRGLPTHYESLVTAALLVTVLLVEYVSQRRRTLSVSTASL
jgi:ribose transport system permease protein